MIHPTPKAAIRAAKDEAIAAYEKATDRMLTTSYCNQLRSRDVWRQTPFAGKCNCGLTGGVKLSVFMRGNLYTGDAVYCSVCGKEGRK